jgi:hypothetical protein
MLKYAEFYCKQDVNLTRLGVLAFRESYLQKYGADIYDYLSIPALAFSLMLENVLYQDHIIAYGGAARDFI